MEDFEDNLNETFQEPKRKFWQVNNYSIELSSHCLD